MVWANSTSFCAFGMHSIGNLFVFFIYKPLKNYVISSGQANMEYFRYTMNENKFDSKPKFSHLNPNKLYYS